MSFMDEKITQLINEVEQSMIPRSITDGPVKIGNQYYEFTLQSFYEDKLSLYLPADFEEMPKEFRSIKYPYEQRPEIIRSDEAGAVNFTLNRVEIDLKDEMVEELTADMKTMIQKSNPSHIFYNSGVETVGGKRLGYFEFKNMVIDGALFNIMYFLEFAGKILMGTFCCRYEDYPDWRDIAYQAVRSITVKAEDEGGAQV